MNIEETVTESLAWVDGEARGDAAIIAVACDSLLVKPGSIIGGPGEATIDAEQVRQAAETWERLANETHRPAGEFYGFLTPDLEMHEFTDRNGNRVIGDTKIFAQRPDADNWQMGPKIQLAHGVTAEEAIARNWAAGLVPNLASVAEQRGLDSLPNRNA